MTSTTQSDKEKNKNTLGSRLRTLRKSRKMTLDQLSKRSGLARSTLSKIENNLMSPTHDALLKLAKGFDLDISGLFSINAQSDPDYKRVVTKASDGEIHETAHYIHRMLGTKWNSKRIHPFYTHVTARSITEETEFSQHIGDDFIYVLQGAIRLFSGDLQPVDLHPGDSVYFSGAIKHALISISLNDAEILWITTQSSKA